jgi:hypothetical protein
VVASIQLEMMEASIHLEVVAASIHLEAVAATAKFAQLQETLPTASHALDP